MKPGAWALVCVGVLALLLLLRVLSREAFEEPRVQAAVIGGVPADVARYPWFCTVGGCGGVLIAPSVVLTAGHCGVVEGAYVTIGMSFTDAIDKALAFGLGRFMTDNKIPFPWDGKAMTPEQAEAVTAHSYVILARFGEVRRAVKVINHPRFDPAKDTMTVGAPNDLTLVLLDKPSTKPPIRLATALPTAGEPMTLIGQGRKKRFDPTDSEAFNTSGSKKLTKTTLQYATPHQAAVFVRKQPGLDPNQEYQDRFVKQAYHPGVLAGVSMHGKSGCYGDSGGPLIVERGPGRDELVGIASYGPAGCSFYAPKVALTFFASVPFYRNWIRTTTNALTI